FELVPDGVDFNNGLVRAIAPDGQGGSWWAVAQVGSRGNGGGSKLAFGAPAPPRAATFFYHYTRDVPRPVFSDVPQPIREPITGVASEQNGTLWLSTASDNVYRYSRATGWDRMSIPGWDAGRLHTRVAQALGVAVNDSGMGVVVGEGGRIADIRGSVVVLD